MLQRVTKLEARKYSNNERFQTFKTKIAVRSKEDQFSKVHMILYPQELHDLIDNDDKFAAKFGRVFENPEVKYEDEDFNLCTTYGYVNT